MTLLKAGFQTSKPLRLVTERTKFVEALRQFERYNVSTLPVVDSLTERRLLNVFAKYDVILIALNGSYKDPEMTVEKAIEIRDQVIAGSLSLLQPSGLEGIPRAPLQGASSRPPVEICLPSETVQTAIDRLIRARVHRLIMVDSAESLIVMGIVSMSDLLNFLILKQTTPSTYSSRVPLERSTTHSALEEEQEEVPMWNYDVLNQLNDSKKREELGQISEKRISRTRSEGSGSSSNSSSCSSRDSSRSSSSSSDSYSSSYSSSAFSAKSALPSFRRSSKKEPEKVEDCLHQVETLVALDEAE
ncbi:hypothetical protein Ciccas_009195 [Cichlidogyrus casuarinus]|uniref:CBS domain-containing protein n=1 Tax=Cichlidogyrus casuarinus TaxID=1844966 RepID=A0ABD2PYR7_9PLAT